MIRDKADMRRSRFRCLSGNNRAELNEMLVDVKLTYFKPIIFNCMKLS